jgi:outer membrane protein assembly factor BamB
MHRRSALLGIVLLGATVMLLLPSQVDSRRRESPGSPAPGAVGPDDWPMYGHDPSRTNYNPDETLLSPATVNQLHFQWEAPVGIAPDSTPAFNAPSIAGGRVFVGSSIATGPNLFALDARTGAPAWNVGVGYNPDGCFGVGIGSTAAISGTTLVIGGGDAAYYGINTVTGAQLWREPLNAGPSGFAWASPLFAQGRAYLGVASDCDDPSVRGEVRSLEASTGGGVSRQYLVPTDTIGAGIWNSPALSPDGQTLVIVTGEDGEKTVQPYSRAIMSLDAQYLTIRQWDRQGTPAIDDDWGTTPIIFHDSQGRTLVGANHKNGTFYAYQLDQISAGPIWSRATGTRVGMMPAYDPTIGPGGTLYIAGEDADWITSIYLVDPATGQDRQPPQAIGSLNGNMALAGGLLFLNVDDSATGSSTLQIRAATDGSLLRTITPPHTGRTYSGVAVAGGTVYWMAGAYLNAWSVLAPPSPTPTPLATPTVCTLTFNDVPPGNPFDAYVRCLACRGLVSGYPCGGPGEPCPGPYFRPNNTITRGQLSKIIANAAGFSDLPSGQAFEDVPPTSPFYLWVERLALRHVIGGYACGGPDEPCVPPLNRRYFRANNHATRGQSAQFIANTAGYQEIPTGQTFADVPPDQPFYRFIERVASRGIVGGYPCGGPGEPCVAPTNRPYYRPGNPTTRGQMTKLATTAFLPGCTTPGR